MVIRLCLRYNILSWWVNLLSFKFLIISTHFALF
uniref:Uncharacterized protein n=1 Tax=Amphimedon queenslandica TaxID=400682 RepID=A0A1X7TQ93_AMPQE